MHSARRREIDNRIARYDAEIAGHDTKLTALDRQMEVHVPAITARKAWERQHRHDLQRLDDVDRTIELVGRLEQITARVIERGADRGVGLEL